VSASTSSAQVETRRTGSFGVLTAEVATPLAMVLTELMQNSIEHGLGAEGGVVEVHAERALGRLRVSVTDSGRGLPTGFDSETSGNLGLSIVRTLVIGDLDGVLEFGPRADGSGTSVVVDVPLKED
jgi:two-component system, sensor histidine kinase PdtaS